MSEINKLWWHKLREELHLPSTTRYFKQNFGIPNITLQPAFSFKASGKFESHRILVFMLDRYN